MNEFPQTKQYYVLSIVTLLFIIGLLAGLSFESGIKELDKGIYDAIGLLHNVDGFAIITIIAKVLTFLGNIEVIIALLIIGVTALYIKHRPFAGQALLTGTFTAGVLVQSLKLIIDRVRPEPFFEIGGVLGMSFPSGHAFVATVFYGFLAFLLARMIKDKQQKQLIYTASYTLIVLIGLSRMWLGVHWASDVGAGLVLGGLLLWLIITFYGLNKPKNGVVALT